MNTEVTACGSVLIVEDDKTLGLLLAEELRDAGLETLWAATAEEAEKTVEARWPDLIVCDLRLPGMDGMSFFRKIQEKGVDPAPAFLMITAL